VIDFPRDRTLVVGHRGSAGTAPENTIASFREAIAAGVDMIEFDVRLTADAQLVVHHDRRLGRVSEGRGSIAAMRLEDIASRNAGAWFAPRFRNEMVPSLDRVLAELPRSVALNIEVKDDRVRRRGRVRPETILLESLRRSQRRDIMVSSFNHALLRRLHALDPSLTIGVLTNPIRDALHHPSTLARRTGARVYVCSQSQLSRPLAEEAHAHGLGVAVYGVRTRKHLDKALSRGADAVITDFPAMMITALRERRR
jgi:glycerophosphoryl diester phosphodiesterase